MAYTQAGRPISIDTPAGTDVLLLERVTGYEAISTPFEFEAEVVSENNSIDPTTLVRQSATITMELAGGAKRYINGYINRFVQLGASYNLTTYRLTLVPSIWQMSIWRDCKIFQNKTTQQIVEAVFSTYGITNYEFHLTGSYQPREYCVQYRETSLDFIHRLLEEDGIYYFFSHSNGSHTLILVDAPSSLNYCAQKSSRMAAAGSASLEQDVVTDLQAEFRANTGKITLNDYNFTTPSTSLLSTQSGKYSEEHYDYPGRYATKSDGDTYAGIRIEEQEAMYRVFRGSSHCRAFASGYKFDLQNHYRRDLNQTYLLVRLTHDMRTNSYRAEDSGAAEFDYSNRFELIPFSTPYRPPRITPKGRVLGAQTALVVGPAGEEIYVDKYGRVKVQFYWDRVGTKDENSSCWIRVSHEWAGKYWGSIHIPRIGQEVVVDFLEGDPDRPLITGRVYNAEQMPPYTLPANMTQSAIKTRSSKQGGTDNYNEIFFEDLKGSELLRIHAEKDQHVEVEHDRAKTVGHDETTTIGNDRTEEVKHDENITIDNNRTELVKNNEQITIQGNRTEMVSKDENITIGQSRTETVAQSETITIGQSRSVEIAESETLTIGESQTITVGESQTVTAGESVTIIASTSITLMAGSNIISLGESGISIVSGEMINMTASMIMIN
jgi:type VI secretion system secreted protein VgrG